MNWYEIVLGVVLIAVSVLIVVFTLAQEQKGQGLSGAIMGESSAMTVHLPPLVVGLPSKTACCKQNAALHCTAAFCVSWFKP